jgi:hypothetical protein
MMAAVVLMEIAVELVLGEFALGAAILCQDVGVLVITAE